MNNVILNGQVVSGTAAVPMIGATVTLKNILSSDPITGERRTSTVGSTITDSSGRVQFSGTDAGKYDISATIGSRNYSLLDYEVKNNYLVNPGGTEELREGRTVVRSQETVGPSGLLFSNEYRRPFVELGNPLNPYPEPVEGSGFITNNYNNTLGDPVTQSTKMNKDIEDRTWLTNQDTQLVQSFIVKIV